MVRKRLKALEEALASRGRMESELLEASRWLNGAQGDLKRLTRAIGHRTEDAHDMLRSTEELIDRLYAYQVHLFYKFCNLSFFSNSRIEQKCNW